jgi:hypothetical protein
MHNHFPVHSTLFPRRRAFGPGRGLPLLAALALLVASAAAAPVAPSAAKDNFMPLVELAPFKVNGKQLAISIHARSKNDRRYAEDFAGEVVKVVYDGVTSDTGKGLVIIGKKGEPHPMVVFRKFLALARDGKLDPAVAARGPELATMLDRWQDAVNDEHASGKGDGKEDDLEFEQIITALPLPLEGIGAKLYQLAWREDFDDAKVDARLRALHAADLEGNLFAHFDWVFYLPPKNAFDQVLDDLVGRAMKEDGAGFFERMAVKSVMLVVRPKIRKAIEALRQGLLFMTIVEARAPYAKGEALALTGAYIGVMMPGEDDKKKDTSGSEHERAVRAVHGKAQELAAKAKPAADAAPAESDPAKAKDD